MTRGFLGSGIAAIIETALSPLDPNGRIPIRVRIVCTSGGNRATDSFELHSSRSEWRGWPRKPIRLAWSGYGSVSKEVEQ